MKRWYLSASLLLSLAPFAFAQDATTTKPQDVPSGTKVVGHEQDTIVAPKKNRVKIDRGVIKAAQEELIERGYDASPADGSLGPKTQAAISKFQADQGIEQTRQLDENTLERLNVGGTRTVGAAPADLGRGGKAAAHNVKEGHPIEAGKSVGSGAASFGKKVGKGAKSVAVEGASKAGKGISAVGGKISDTVEGDKKKKPDTDPSNDPK